MTAEPTPNDAPQPADRRAALLRATGELFLERGLAGTRTRDVTERSGVGTGLLNHYFRWSDLRALAWGSIFDAVTAETLAPDRPPAEALEIWFASAFAPGADRFWRLWLEAADLAKTDPPLAEVLDRTQRRMDDALAAILSAGRTSGLWQLPDPAATALRLAALNDGLAGRLLAQPARLSPEQAEAHLRQAFWLEVASPGP